VLGVIEGVADALARVASRLGGALAGIPTMAVLSAGHIAEDPP